LTVTVSRSAPACGVLRSRLRRGRVQENLSAGRLTGWPVQPQRIAKVNEEELRRPGSAAAHRAGR
jgi:hypothetical protein